MEINPYNLKKLAQATQQNVMPNRPPNPMVMQMLNTARGAGIYGNAAISLSEGDKAELENLQFAIRRLLIRVGFPRNRIRM